MQVYLHHYVADGRFTAAEGSESRGSPFKIPLPEPYAFVVDGALLEDNPVLLYANIHVINTVGVEPSFVQRCIECWWAAAPHQLSPQSGPAQG